MAQYTHNIKQESFMYRPKLHTIKANNITHDVLLSEHKKLMALYKKGSIENEVIPTTFDSKLYDLAETAKTASKAIISCDEETLTFGPFASARITLPTIGETVTIPNGATIYSVHPNPAKAITTAKRDRTVIVSSVQCGFYDNHSGKGFISSKVEWAGDGGYWHWIKLDNTHDFWKHNNNKAYTDGPICEACGQESC